MTRFFISMSNLLIVFLSLTFYVLSVSADPQPGSAEQMLAKVDQYRNFKDTAFSFDLLLVSEEKGKDKKEFVLHAKILNAHTSLVSYRQPVREQGKALLMNGRNMWFFSSMAQKPIRITPQQRLLGEASNGDVASTDFSGDYLVEFHEQDSSAAKNDSQRVLQLVARNDSLAAYAKIVLWVKADSAQPIKAEFYSESGKHLKTAYYTQFTPLENFDGKVQMTELEIHNALRDGSVTRMRYSNFKLEDLQESQFRPDQVRRLIAQ